MDGTPAGTRRRRRIGQGNPKHRRPRGRAASAGPRNAVRWSGWCRRHGGGAPVATASSCLSVCLAHVGPLAPALQVFFSCLVLVGYTLDLRLLRNKQLPTLNLACKAASAHLRFLFCMDRCRSVSTHGASSTGSTISGGGRRGPPGKKTRREGWWTGGGVKRKGRSASVRHRRKPLSYSTSSSSFTQCPPVPHGWSWIISGRVVRALPFA
jgi:hypothetical protein